MNKKKIAALLSGIVVLSINSAFAADATGNFQTTSTLNSKCIVSSTDLNFGTLDLVNISGSIAATGEVTVFCSKGVSYTVVPEGGYNDGYERVMKGTSTNKDALYYQLYKTQGTMSTWTRVSNNRITGIGSGENQNIPITAITNRIYQPKNTDPTVTNQWNYEASPDSYSETITATVTY